MESVCSEVTPTISVPYLSDVERGARPLPFNRLEPLADVYLLRGVQRARLYQLAGKLPISVEQALLNAPDTWGLNYDKLLNVALKACSTTDPELARMAKNALKRNDW